MPTKAKHSHRNVMQEFKVTLETELAESRSYSMALEETLSEAVNALEVTNQEKLNLKAELEKALKESTLKSAKLADIESECAALVCTYEPQLFIQRIPAGVFGLNHCSSRGSIASTLYVYLICG